jgi:hypothetical protein
MTTILPAAYSMTDAELREVIAGDYDRFDASACRRLLGIQTFGSGLCSDCDDDIRRAWSCVQDLRAGKAKAAQR